MRVIVGMSGSDGRGRSLPPSGPLGVRALRRSRASAIAFLRSSRRRGDEALDMLGHLLDLREVVAPRCVLEAPGELLGGGVRVSTSNASACAIVVDLGGTCGAAVRTRRQPFDLEQRSLVRRIELPSGEDLPR